jgi:hypothetical protein
LRNVNADNAAVRPVRGAERFEHVEVAETRQLAPELAHLLRRRADLRTILCNAAARLFDVETQVLAEEDGARLAVERRLDDAVADAVVEKDDVRAGQMFLLCL